MRVLVSDKDGGATEYVFNVTVANVPPTFTLGADPLVGPGGLARTVTFADPGADAWTATVDYGDGAGFVPLAVDQATRSFVLNHAYTASGVYAAHVRLDDGEGAVDRSFSVRVDRDPPASAAVALPATSPGKFTVSWVGADGVGQTASGVATYDVYVSDNGGAPTRWLAGTTATSATYAGQQGHSYAFYTVATDNIGNVESAPAAPDATTFVADGVAPTVVAADFQGPTPVVVHGPYLTVQFSEKVNVVLSGLVVHNLTTGVNAIPSEVAFDGQSNTLLMKFAALADGNYTLTLPSAAVSDVAGNFLAKDFALPFFSLVGDVNRDRMVNQADRDLVTAALGTAGVRPQDGDANGDGFVDFLDLARLAQHYNVPTGNTLLDGDFNGDGAVDFLDLAVMAQHYNTGGRFDLNGDGIVNQADLDLVNANLGKALPNPSGSSTVSRVSAAPVPAGLNATETFAQAWAIATGTASPAVSPVPPSTTVPRPQPAPTPSYGIEPKPVIVLKPARPAPAKRPPVPVSKKVAADPASASKKATRAVVPPVFSIKRIMVAGRKRSDVLS